MRLKVHLNIHLDPNHKAFLLIEAPNAEEVRDYLIGADTTTTLKTSSTS